MDLKTVFSSVIGNGSDSKKKGEYFLAVKISSAAVLATAWTIKDGKVEIGEIGTGEVEGETFDAVLEATDKAVSLANKNIPIEVSKVIFAVPFNWSEEGKLNPEKLKELRSLCKQLDLFPQGFVVLTEALESYYKEVEGAPLTAILIGVDPKQSVLTVFRAGKDLGTVDLTLEGELTPTNLVTAIEKVLKRFTHLDVLPARIILYDSKSNLEKISQAITAHPWTQKLPFLHFPKVEIAPAEFVVKSVAVAGGLQMGGELELTGNEETLSAEAELPPEMSVSEEKAAEEERAADIEKTELEEVSAEEAGFEAEGDFGNIAIPLKPPPPEEELPSSSFSPLPPPVTSSPVKISPKEKIPANKFALFSSVNHLKSQAANFFHKLALSQIKPGPKPLVKFLPFAVVAAVIIALLGIGLLFLPKVTAIITVNAKNFDHDIDVSVVTDNSQLSNQAILGTIIDASEIGTKKGVSSGKKLVGEKARGTVTIFSVSDSKKFSAGTNLISPDGLKFTLDNDASIASGDAITPATTSVSVTAVDIGSKYNLPAGTKFSLSGASSNYLAKNDNPLAGGNSHEATVVTKADQDRLMATLSAELSAKAKTDLESKLQSNQKLLPNAITSEIAKKKFSKEVDAESDTVSLDLTLNYKGIVFSKEDIVTLMTSQFSSDIPAGYALKPEDSIVDVKTVKIDKKGNNLLTVSLSANLVPSLNKYEITNHISGKSLKSATDYITTLPGVSGVNLDIQPSIFKNIVKLFLPWRKENIKIEIVTQ